MSDISDGRILDELANRLAVRAKEDPSASYTAQLLANAPEKPVRKLSEETVELVIEAMKGDKQAAIRESADLLYHLLVVWQAMDIDTSAVWAELISRQSQSGIEEKNSR